MNQHHRYGIAAVVAITCLVFVASRRLAEEPSRPSGVRTASAASEVRPDAPALEVRTPSADTTPAARRGDENDDLARPDGGESSSVVDEANEASLAAMREYEAVRAPVVQAIRRLDLGSLDRRAAILAALEESGPSSEPFTQVAPEVLASWTRAVPRAAAATHVGETRCFKAGCETTVRFADADAYRDASAAFRAINDPGAPHGGRVQVPPAVRPDGSVEAVWIMLRPAPVL